MSVDITTLVLEVKSQGIDQATTSLNNLANASEKAEAATNNLGTTSKKTNSSYADGVAAADKLLATYQKQVDLLGATISQQYAYNVSLKGGNESQVQAALALGAQQDAYKRLAADQAEAIRMNKALDASLQGVSSSGGHATGSVSGLVRELVVMGHEISQGQVTRLYGSMVVMAERADVAGRSVKAFKAAVAEAGGSVLAIAAPIAAVVAVVGTLSAAFLTWLHSTQAIHEFNQELILTGGYAGKSANELYTMADSIGKVYGNVGVAREAMMKLVSAGKFSSDQINDITKAAVGLYTYGGVSIDKTIAQFEKLAKEPLTGTERSFSQVTKAAVELDASLHFLEPQTLAAAIAQEKLGNSQEASIMITKELAAEETKRAQELEENMTMLGKLAHTVGAAFTNMWNSLWTTKSPQQELSGVVAQLKALPEITDQTSILRAKGITEQKQELLLKAAKLQNQVLAEQDKAAAEAADKQIKRDANEAQIYLRSIDDKVKGATRFSEVEAKINEAEAKDAAAGIITTKEVHEARIAWAHKEYDEKHKVKAMGFADINTEIVGIKALLQTQIDADDQEIKSAQALYAVKKADAITTEQDIAKAIQDKINKTNEAYVQEQTALAKSASDGKRTATEIMELQGRIAAAYKDHEKAITSLNDAMEKNGTLAESVLVKAYDDEDKATKKTVDSLNAKTKELEAQVAAYNKLPESVKRAGVTEKQMQDQYTQARIDSINLQIASEEKDAMANDYYHQQRIKNLKEERDAMVLNMQAQSSKEAVDAQNKAFQDYNQKWRELDKQINNDLAEAIIDGGGKGWKKLIQDMKLAFAKLVLQPILAPISSGIASLATTVLPSSATTATTAIGGAGSAVSLASMASNIYSAITTGFAGLSTGVANVVQSGLYATGLSNNILTNGAFANGAGALASAGAGIFGGLGLGNLLSNGLGNKSTTTVTTLAGAIAGSLLPGIGTALGSLLGGGLGGLINGLFGHGPKEVTSQGISGTISDSGITGQAYSNWHQKGGLFSGSKNGTDMTPLSQDIINTFGSTLDSLKAASTGLAKNLNVSADALNNYSKTFDITLTNDASKNQQAITDFFTTMGDDMATKLVPNIADFAKTGETASVTLQRLSETFQATNAIMNLFGADTAKVFGGLGLESAKARQYLVDLAGGISNLNTQVSFYASNFLTDAEKIAPVQKAVSEALSQLGYSSITTITQFKAVVNSLDLTTQSGAQTFEALMQLAPAFKQVADAADAAAKAQQDAAQAALDAAQAAKEAEAKALSDKLASLKTVAQGDFDVLSKSITTAKNNAQAAYDAQAAILNAQISSLTVIKNNIDSLSSALDNAIGTMINNTEMAMSRAAAQGMLDQVLVAAKAGNLPNANDLKEMLTTLGKDSSSSFSSYTDYAKDLGVTAGKLADLDTITKDQGTVVDKQLATAKDQLAQAKAALDAELAKYDLMLNLAQEQLDAMNGTQLAVKDLTSAIYSFNGSVNAAIVAQQKAGVIANNGVTAAAGQMNAPQSVSDAQIANLYQTILGRTATSAEIAFQHNAAAGWSASDLAQFFYNSPEYLSKHPNGSHANGLDNVPFDGYTARLHKGEMVLPAKQAQGVAQGSDMQGLLKEVKQLREDNSAENQSLVSDIKFLKKLFQNMTPSGDRIQTYEVGAPT